MHQDETSSSVPQEDPELVSLKCLSLNQRPPAFKQQAKGKIFFFTFHTGENRSKWEITEKLYVKGKITSAKRGLDLQM